MKKVFGDYKLSYYALFFIILLSFYRSPYLFINGRFFAEEGSEHFANVYQNGFFLNLFFVEIKAGYINLIANILTSFASLVPLNFSPLITVYGSLIFVLLPVYLILFRSSELFDQNFKKIIAAFIFFISTPLVPEIWLNSINLQIYFCLSAIIILFMNNLNSFQKKFNNIIIFLGSFSGIYTCSLLPFFIFRYIFRKSSYNLKNLIILCIGNIVQILLIINSSINSALTSSALKFDISSNSIYLLIYNNLIRPLLGKELSVYLWESIFSDSNILLKYGFIIILFLVICFIIFNLKKICSDILINRNIIFLLLIFFVICLVIFLGSVGSYYGGRYSAIPGVLVITIIFYSIFLTKNKLKLLLIFLFIVSMSNGINEFRPYDKKSSVGLKLLDCIDCPKWKDEIKKWEEDNSYNIVIWPYPSKKMNLK